MSCDYFDALRFKARRNVYFCGIGSLKNYQGKPFVMEMKFRVIKDGEDVEPITIEVNSEKSPENEEKMHWFDI
jgi:hypothetical protein